MADDPDGIDEAFEGMLRVGLTAAGRLAEVAARAREQAARQARAASQAQARELGARLQVERAAARAQLVPVGRTEWWDRAQAGDVARVWETAAGWRSLDLVAEQAAARIRAEVRDRYGVDVDAPGADPAAVRAALERRGVAEAEVGGPRGDARREQADAAQLLAAADRADRSQGPEQPQRSSGTSTPDYDNADRRRELADSLSGVADGEAVSARVAADTFQARPAAQAVAQSPRHAPAARRAPRAGSRTRQRSPEAGR